MKVSKYLLVTLLTACIMTTIIKAEAQESKGPEQLIAEGFKKWAKGTGSFFDLLSEDMQWTITGSTPLSKIYRGKKEFMEQVIVPLNQRLSQKIVPTVRKLITNGEEVVALWDGVATAADGKPYNMSYAWFMQVKGGKIVSVVAFLDGIAFTDVMTRKM